MPFIVKKRINGNDYYYLRQSIREEGKVVSKYLAYLGKNRGEAEKKAKEIMNNIETNQKIVAGNVPKTEEPTEATKISVDDMAMFCKRKGFVYASGEIYGGLAGFWDFGPLGAELKNNLKREWWKYHVYSREDVVGIDGSIITHPMVWKASGHVDSFSDVFVVCKECKKPSKIDRAEIGKVKCINCQGEYDFANAKDFMLMFKTTVGLDTLAYLRPETAQLIFADFKSVSENSRAKLPFGIAQIGKAFRNEIAPRDFIFRNREFEQMEIEYFVKPGEDCPYEIPNEEILVFSAEAQEKAEEPVKMKFKEALEKGIIKKKWHAYWLSNEFLFFKNLGANTDNFRIRQHAKTELAHYSSDCWDLEYNFPFGWKELEGIADRSNYDLKQHEKFSKKDLTVFDEETKERFLPEVICEPSLGVERAFLVFMFDAYHDDKKRNNIVLKLHPKLSPVKAAIFPIIKKPEFEEIATKVLSILNQEWNVLYDKSGSIGRRYARNDEAGTPYCITIDGDSLKNNDVTIRDRDTTQQIRVKVSDVKDVLRKLINREIEFEKAGRKL